MKSKIFLLFLFVATFMETKKASAQIKIRSLSELTADTSGWELVLNDAKKAKNKVEILPVDRKRADDALFQTQVTTHSYIGAIIYFTGGVLVDNGWIRLLGSGSKRIPRSLPIWNKGKTFKEFGDPIGYLLFADDVIGGFFAINSGLLGKDKGNVYYLAPDTLQ